MQFSPQGDNMLINFWQGSKFLQFSPFCTHFGGVVLNHHWDFKGSNCYFALPCSCTEAEGKPLEASENHSERNSPNLSVNRRWKHFWLWWSPSPGTCQMSIFPSENESPCPKDAFDTYFIDLKPHLDDLGLLLLSCQVDTVIKKVSNIIKIHVKMLSKVQRNQFWCQNCHSTCPWWRWSSQSKLYSSSVDREVWWIGFLMLKMSFNMSLVKVIITVKTVLALCWWEGLVIPIQKWILMPSYCLLTRARKC